MVIARLWDHSRSLCCIFSQAGQHHDLLLSQHLEPSGRRGSAVCALGAGPTSAPFLGPLVSWHVSVQRAGLHYKRPSFHYGKCLAQEAPVDDTIPAVIFLDGALASAVSCLTARSAAALTPRPHPNPVVPVFFHPPGTTLENCILPVEVSQCQKVRARSSQAVGSARSSHSSPRGKRKPWEDQSGHSSDHHENSLGAVTASHWYPLGEGKPSFVDTHA